VLRAVALFYAWTVGGGIAIAVIAMLARDLRDAVRRWVMDIRASHLLLEDPLRTKVQSFELLSGEERRAWIAHARTALRAKLAEVESYGAEVDATLARYVG